MPGVQTTFRIVRSGAWWRTPTLPSRGVPSAASTSEGPATVRSRSSFTASSGADCFSAARQSVTNWSTFSMRFFLLHRDDGTVPALCPMHCWNVKVCPAGGGTAMKQRTKLGMLSCVLLVAACSAPAATQNGGGPEAGPRFASGGPDAEEYGAGLGYPKGE